MTAWLKEYNKEANIMGRKKVDRSNKVIQTVEITKPLKQRLEWLAEEHNKTVSATIREILENYLENREYIK